jgi:hypothetical protein
MQNNISVSREVALQWFNFSEFMPSFLRRLSSYVIDPLSKRVLLDIMDEEEGLNDGQAHSVLFLDAIKEIGFILTSQQGESLERFQKEFDQFLKVVTDKEAFVLGVNYGLEVFAQDNIGKLLNLCSYDEDTLKKLKNSLFFEIHLLNEVKHINLCRNNLARLLEEKRDQDFMKGANIAINFWNNFWSQFL